LDAHRFDRLARLLGSARSRRAVLAALGAAVTPTLNSASAQSGCSVWHEVLPNGACATPCWGGYDGTIDQCADFGCGGCSATMEGQQLCYREERLDFRCSSTLRCPSSFFCGANGYCMVSCA
jgi:hypothetical protein